MSARRPLALVRDCLAVLVVGLFLAPLAFWTLTAFRPSEAALSMEFEPFRPLTLDNFRAVLAGELWTGSVGQGAFFDSLLIAAGSTLLSVTAGLMAAYALSRMPFRAAHGVSLALLAFRVVPTVALIIPAFTMFHAIGLFDTRIGVMLMHAVVNLPIAVLMLKSFLDDMPREIDEAAKIDGANSFQLLFRILLPLLRGGVAATAIIVFIFSWTEFVMSLFLTSSFRTLPVRLSLLAGNQWGPLAALSMASILPVFLLALAAHRHLVRGLTLGMQK